MNNMEVWNPKRRTEVSIIVPAYNEEKSILRVMRAIRDYAALPANAENTEVLVLDDGSRDNTWAVVEGYARRNGFSAVRFEKNKGKGEVMAEGIRLSKGEILVFIDADLLGLRKEHLERLIGPVRANYCIEAIGVQDIFDPEMIIRPTNFASYYIPTISGQRAVRREFLPLDKRVVSRYGATRFLIENLINRTVDYLLDSAVNDIGSAEKKRHLRNRGILVFVLDGVSQVVKERKRGIVRGTIERGKMWGELFLAKKKLQDFSLPKIRIGTARKYLESHPLVCDKRLTRLREEVALLRYYQIQNKLKKSRRIRSLGLKSMLEMSRNVINASLNIGEKLLPEKKFPYSVKSRRIMVIAPHCDDESLGAGGLMYRARRMGSEVRVVIVTDSNKKKNGMLRKRESRTALAHFGIRNDSIVFLDAPESGLKRSRRLENSLRREILRFGPHIVIGPSALDFHPHHRIIGRILESTKLSKSTRRLYYIIWQNFINYLTPFGYQPKRYMLPPRRFRDKSLRWHYFVLSDEEEKKKEIAIREYKTQERFTNPFIRNLLMSFVRKNELFMELSDEKENAPSRKINK